jgi:hypothetical protein
MESFSDGPSRQNPLDFPLHSSSPHDMRQHLQNLLDGKEKQLQQAGALGERLLAQRVELEGRVRLLQEVDADKSDEITADMRERYRELADTVRAWEFGNVQLTSTFTFSVRILVVRTVSPLTDPFAICFAFLDLFWPCASASIAVIDPLLSRFRISMVPSNPSLSSSTRLYEMNPNDQSLHLALLLLSLAERKMLLTVPMTLVCIAFQHPHTRTHMRTISEFAFEIGSGLLTEVRRLQSLLAERDKAIQDMKEEKDDLEKSIESIRGALKLQEQSTGLRYCCFDSHSTLTFRQTNTRGELEPRGCLARPSESVFGFAEYCPTSRK